MEQEFLQESNESADEEDSKAEISSEEQDSDVDSDEGNTKTKSKRRRVSFAPGLITGKSDVEHISKEKEARRDDNNSNNMSNNENSNSNDNNGSNINSGNSDNEEVIISDNLTLNLTNFWQNGGMGSGSETSDNEMDFEKTTKKYQHWSPQYMKQIERNEKAKQEISKLKKELKKLKKNEKLILNKVENGEKKTIKNEKSKKKTVKPMTNSQFKEWKEKESKKGVIYCSSLPFGCTGYQLKKIFSEFGCRITNVHLETANGRVTENSNNINANSKFGKKIYNKWNNYCEAWIEFEDKEVAKLVPRLINNTKIPKKYVNNWRAKQHVWELQYLKGFKWHHLREHKQSVRILQRKKLERAIETSKMQATHFREQYNEAKKMKNQFVQQLKNKNKTKNLRKDSSLLRKDNGNDTNHNNENENDTGYNGDDNDEPPKKKRRTVQQRQPKRKINNKKQLKQLTSQLFSENTVSND